MKVTVRRRDGVGEVDGLPCGVPGLAVTRWVTSQRGLHIVHVRSGVSVAYFGDVDPEAVLAAAQELAPLADWTVSGTELQAREGLAMEVYTVASRFGGDMNHRTPPAAVDLTAVPS